MQSSGTGNFTIGYLGGLMDNATNLIYVGNGQYYDPSTGRFLSRDVNPNSTNPYVPWGGNPTGALFTPLALLFLVYSCRKKRGTLDTIVVLIVLSTALGLGLSACQTTLQTPFGTVAVTATPNPNGTVAVAVTVTPSPTSTPSGTPTNTPTATCTATVVPITDDDYKTQISTRFGITLSDDTGKWHTTEIHIAFGALSNIDAALNGMLKTLLNGPKTFYIKWNQNNYGGTTYPQRINFRYNGRFPYLLIYHEMGHLLNYSLGGRFVNALNHGEVTADGEVVMGRDKPQSDYHRNNWAGYKDHYLTDPNGFTLRALMHPAGAGDFDGTGNTPDEDWGDMFANFVAGNIDLTTAAGKARYDWTIKYLFQK